MQKTVAEADTCRPREWVPEHWGTEAALERCLSFAGFLNDLANYPEMLTRQYYTSH